MKKSKEFIKLHDSEKENKKAFANFRHYYIAYFCHNACRLGLKCNFSKVSSINSYRVSSKTKNKKKQLQRQYDKWEFK